MNENKEKNIVVSYMKYLEIMQSPKLFVSHMPIILGISYIVKRCKNHQVSIAIMLVYS